MRAPALRLNPTGREFESLYRRHVHDVYRYVLAMLDRAADAEDATQTTFLNAYRALERGERPRHADEWLRAIALNVCREHYRRASRRPDEVSLERDPGELVPDPPTPAIGEVMRGLSCLPFNQRAALVMREFEGRSLAEIAAALGVSGSAVEALLFRGRRALREQLEGSLSCAQAEQALSRQLDGALPRADRGPLRAHLRECRECASLARRLRAQRSAVRSLALVPVPASLRLGKLVTGGAAGAAAPAGVSTGGSLLASLTGSIAAKVSVAAIVGTAAIGAGYASLHHQTPAVGHMRPVASTVQRPSTATPGQVAPVGPPILALSSHHRVGRSARAGGSGAARASPARIRAERRSAALAASTSHGQHRGLARRSQASHGHPTRSNGATPAQARGQSASHASGGQHARGHQHRAPPGRGRPSASPGKVTQRTVATRPAHPAKPSASGPVLSHPAHGSSPGHSSATTSQRHASPNANANAQANTSANGSANANANANSHPSQAAGKGNGVG